MIYQLYRRCKRLLCIIFVFLLVLLSITSVFADNQAEISVSRSEEIFKAITESESLEPIIFHLSEESDEFATRIKLFTDGLDKEGGGKGIDPTLFTITREGGVDATEYFVLNKNDLIQISITIKTENVSPGTYKGKVIIDATNATNKEVLLKIQVSKPLWLAVILNLIGVGLGVVVVVVGISVGQQEAGKMDTIQVLKKELIKQFSMANLLKQIKSVFGVAFVIFWTFVIAFIGIYPKLGAFGASPIDYLTIITYGVTQVGASKIAADVLKKK